MSYVKEKGFLEKIKNVRSIKSFAQNFLLDNMLGQKLFLFNTSLPRVLNISFNEHTCMFKCKICPYSNNEIRDLYKEKKEMDFETLKRIVDSVPNDPYYSFDISSIGETLEFENLAKFIKYMKSKRPLVNTIISTNGLLLNEKKAKDLIESGLDNIQLSLFSGNKEEHKFITQTDTYEVVKRNIMTLKRIREELNSDKPFIQTFMIETKENSHLKEDFLQEWSEYVDKAFIRPMYKMGYEIEGMTPVYEEGSEKKRYPCIAPWYSTSIVSNGDILGCYMFNWHKKEKESMVIGNINKNTLYEIYNSSKNKAFRKGHLELKNCDACEKCNLWSAYTDIWEYKNGEYSLPKPKIKDLFNKDLEYRGG